MNKFACKSIGLVAALAFAPLSWAGSGVIITYGPLAQSVPALSGWMLGIMGLLLALLAYRGILAKRGNNKLASLVGMAIAGSTLTVGVDFTQEARATGCSNPNMCTPNGGTIPVVCGSSVTIWNQSGNTQQIQSIVQDPPSVNYSGTCQVNTVVPANQSCSINVVCGGAEG